MPTSNYPEFFTACFYSNEDAMTQVVKNGACVASGFASSEPHTFYTHLWDFIQKHDITDFEIKQALFMAPHDVCLGDTLRSKGMFSDAAKGSSGFHFMSGLAKKVNAVTQKVEGLKTLIAHYEELKARRIKFTSPFIGGATNIIIPPNAITRTLFPDYVGRNTTRMGVTDMQSIHFPDAVDSLGYDPDGKPKATAFAAVMTPPNEQGDMSHSIANGANHEIITKILDRKDVNLLLYVNKKYPFTTGYDDAPNTINISAFKGLAEAGRLFVVEDHDGKIPALPANSFDTPSEVENAISDNVVNHIELNRRFTYGRAIQVGFGSTGVLAIRGLKDSSWTGRGYTEMMEPFTMDLFEAGKIKGTHFIGKDGRRTEVDGKMVCTFTLAEEGSDFYTKLHNNENIIVAQASRVVVPEGFYGGLGINNCLSIDYHGHVSSGGRYENHHSGVGGGAQIFRGLGVGGVGYLCLKSTFKGLDGKLKSSIMPFMTRGTPISHIGPDLMGGRDGARLFVATEHGITQVSGKSQWEFIKGLISIADPRFQDWLKAEAFKEFRIRV